MLSTKIEGESYMLFFRACSDLIDLKFNSIVEVFDIAHDRAFGR